MLVKKKGDGSCFGVDIKPTFHMPISISSLTEKG